MSAPAKYNTTEVLPDGDAPQNPSRQDGYLPIEDYSIIGNLRTAALLGRDGSIDSFCYPYFDSPSVFARILDDKKGGHFSVAPTVHANIKQDYLPNTAIVVTTFLGQGGICRITDFMPRPAPSRGVGYPESRAFLPWLIRQVEVTRGRVPLHLECVPAFNYAQERHFLKITSLKEKLPVPIATFSTPDLTLELRALPIPSADSPHKPPEIDFVKGKREGQLSDGVFADFTLARGEVVTFILREPPGRVNESDGDSTDSPVDACTGQEEAGITGSLKFCAGTESRLTNAGHQLPPQAQSIGRNEGGLPKGKRDMDGAGAMAGEAMRAENTDDSGSASQQLPRSSRIPRYSRPTPKRLPSAYSSASLGDLAEVPDGPLAEEAEEGRDEDDPILTISLIDDLLRDTASYWNNWVSKSKYVGRWREHVRRSAITLKLLTFEPTGALVASPTFSLPQDLGSCKNWDYRYTWIRDASFAIYGLLMLGFTDEAKAFMGFWQARIRGKKEDGGIAPLQRSFTIHGGPVPEETELSHLEGYKGSRPVRVGNSSSHHLQLDGYGELMEGIYMFDTYGRPCSWDLWVDARKVVDFICDNWQQKDSSVWESRGVDENYVHTKIMCWNAIDKGLRVADKRSLPCPNREKWYATRSAIYEEVQTKGWNAKKRFYCQSYESVDTLDSALLMIPTTFFSSAADPRFISTLKQMLRTPDNGGLTENGLVLKFNVQRTSEQVGGREENAFAMTTMWMVDALTQAGAHNKAMLQRAIHMFEEALSYANHVLLYSEEVSPQSAQSLGNMPQALTHVSLIYAAYNLDLVLSGNGGKPEEDY